jgi:hypothetical protein
LVRGRTNAWSVLEQLLAIYAAAREKADAQKADKIETAVREYPFAGVLAALLRIAAGPDAGLLVAGECLQALQRSPEIWNWI